MSDTSINQIIQYGTAADRAAYTPAPPAGIKTLYIWYDTDSAPDTWIWDGSAWVQINVGAGLGITDLTGDVTATGPGSAAATLANTAVTPAAYGDATHVTALTVDSKGRLTAASSVAITFPPDTGITELTSDVVAGPGSGSQAATIANNAITTAKINNGAVTEAKQTLANNTTNDVSITAHGYAPILPNDATKYLDGTGGYTVPSGTGSPAIQKLSFTIDNSGSAITATGLQKYFSFPCTGTIVGVRILADQSGSIVFDIWKDIWANRPPVVGDSIIGAGTYPTLSSAQFYEDTTFTSWTTVAVTAGDLGAISISGPATLTWAILEIFIQPS